MALFADDQLGFAVHFRSSDFFVFPESQYIPSICTNLSTPHVGSKFEQVMARLTKEQREAELFRTRAAELLEDPDWLDEEVQRWLRKELERERCYIYSDKEHAAMRRIIAASTLFEGWDGYPVPELIVTASKHAAAHSYEGETFVKELQAKGATKLRLGEMRQLLELCRFAGLDLPRFDPEIESYDEAA